MPDDNIPPCHCAMKWSRKCGDKRKICFDLEAFVNDSAFGSRLGWFYSFAALHVSRYGETASSSLSAWVAIIWQENIAEIPLAFVIIEEMVEKKLSYSCRMNRSISQLFWRQIRGNHLRGWILSFAATLPYFYLSLETSHPQKNLKNCKMKKDFSITAEMASYLTVSGDVASLINSAFNIFRVACPGEVGGENRLFHLIPSSDDLWPTIFSLTFI